MVKTNLEPTELVDAVDHEREILAFVEAESLARRAEFALRLTRVMSIGLAVMTPVIGGVWLMDTQYTQLLVFALIVAQAVVGTRLYQVLHHRRKTIAGMNTFIITCLILLAACPLLIPDTMIASSIGYVVMIAIGVLLLGKKGSRWLIVATAGAFFLDLYVVTVALPEWFTPLSGTVNDVVGASVAISAFLIGIATLFLIVGGQEEQFWEAQLASLEIERRMTEELMQREMLTQANLEIEQRAAIERGQSEHLRALTIQILDTATQLTSAANELQATITQLTASAAEQDAVVTQFAATVEEVRTTVLQTAERAQNVADASQQSMSVSHTGNQMIVETIDGMTLIGQQVDDIAETILLLSERTQQIGEIIETVNALADQSKLLALNASIEAARAGEEGKGFAVVAMEVRQLAEQSREATARVRDILNDIQNATNTAVMVTEQGSKGTEAGMNRAERAGEVIGKLAATVESAAQISEQIAVSTRQQTTGVDQLATAMTQIKQTSSQNAAAMKQAEQSVRDLQVMASQLEEVAGRYDLEEVQRELA